MTPMDAWHVYPVADLVEHETTGDACVCIPTVEHSEGDWIYTHHSLDGRELTEPSPYRSQA